MPPYVLPDWEWQLLNSDGTYLGPLGSATSRSVSWPLDGPATAQFTMVAKAAPHPTGPPLDVLLVKELATDLLVSRTNPVTSIVKTVFRGRITASTESHDGTGDTVAFTATDYRGMLDHRLIWPGTEVDFTAVPQDAANICWTLIQTMQLLEGGTGAGDYDLGITQGVANYPSYNTSQLFTVGNTIGSAITELGDASAPDGTAGFDWTVDENLVFKLWHPHRGADHGVDLTYGDNLAGVTITVTPDGYANAIYMTGGQHTTPYPPSTGPGYGAPVPPGYGAWDQQKSDPNQILQAALVDAAKGWLQQLSPVLYQAVVATLPAGVWDPATAWVGDTVHLTIDVGRLSASGRPFRVDQIDVTLDDNGVEVVSLNLGQSPPKLARRFATIHKRTSKLELEKKDHALDKQLGVPIPANTWTAVTAYLPPPDSGFDSVLYRCQVHIYVPSLAPDVVCLIGARARFSLFGVPQTMTIVPLQAMTTGVWSPQSVQLQTTPGAAVTVEAYSNTAGTTVSGQIESV